MNPTRWLGLIVLLPLFCCTLDGQNLTPPKKLKVCVDKICEDLTWAGDHYDAIREDKPGLDARYWVRRWTADGIEMEAKTAYAVDGVFPMEGIVTGKIGPSGNRIDHAIYDWKVGYSKTGQLAFSISWDKAAGGIEVADVSSAQLGHRSKTHPNILLPPGASENYAAYRREVRAILTATHPLSSADAKRTCAQVTLAINPDTALEIAKYAYRADEIARGNCWLAAAEARSNARARTLEALGWITGWQGTPDPAKAFSHLTLISEKDPWAMYLIEVCTREGIGTKEDGAAADRMAIWFSLGGPERRDLKLDSDDLEVRRQNEREAAVANAPTIEDPGCRPRFDRGIKTKDCPRIVDKDSLNETLSAIDARYADIK